MNTTTTTTTTVLPEAAWAPRQTIRLDHRMRGRRGIRVPATDHRYTLSLKDSGAVRGVYDSVETARAAAPGLAGPKGTYRVTAVHPVECPCSPTDRVMDGED